MRSWFVVIALAVGCQKHAPDCESAVNGAIDRMVEDARGHMPPAAAANMTRVVPQMKKVITAACVEDRWAPAVIACIAKAKDKQGLDLCDAQLTDAQRVSERKRQDEILKTAVQPLDPGPGAAKRPPPDPHAGMDLGSGAH